MIKKEWDKNLRLKWRRQLINMYLYRDAPATRQCEFSSSSFNEVSLRFKIWIIFWCYTRCCCLLLLLTWRGTLLWTIPQRKQGKRWLHNWLRQLLLLSHVLMIKNELFHKTVTLFYKDLQCLRLISQILDDWPIVGAIRYL